MRAFLSAARNSAFTCVPRFCRPPTRAFAALIAAAIVGACPVAPAVARDIQVPGQAFLIEPSVAAAFERSRQECLRRGCDGIDTRYWWAVIRHPTNGLAAIVIATPPFDCAGCTAAEEAALVPTLSSDWAVFEGAPDGTMSPMLIPAAPADQ